MRLQGNFENNLANAFNLINTGKLDDAISLFESLTKNYPNTARGFHFKAFAYTKKNNFSKALESIEKAKMLAPNSIDISIDKSNILNSLGKTGKAIELLKSIENNKEEDTRIFYNLGCIYMDQKNYDDAVHYFKKTIQIDPENKQASFNIGISLFNSSKFELAINVFKAYQKDYGQNFEAERYISLSYYSIDKLEEAERSLQILTTLKPNEPSVWFDRGVILAGLRKNFDAIHCYQKSLELSPDFNSAFWNMAILFQREGKILELIELFEKSKKDNNNCYIFHSHLAQAYLLADNLEDSLKMIRISLEIFLKNKEKDYKYIQLLLIKGNILTGKENFREAIKVYKEAITIDGRIEQPYIKLGNALLNSDQAKEAIPYLKKAIELNPNFALSHTYLGNAFYMLGNKEESLKCFEKAQELDPQTSSVALSTQAMAHLESGNHNSAILSLVESIKKDPYNPNAYINLAVFFRDKNKPEEAINWLKKGIIILKSQPYKDKKLATSYTNLGYCYLDIDKYKNMKEAFEEAIKYDVSHPSVAGYLCYAKLFTSDWNNLKKYKNLAIKMIKQNKAVSSPFCSFSITDDPALQKTVALNYAKAREKNIFIGKTYSYENNRKHKRPRVAYLSNDFHDHATMQLMAGLFENQNHNEFDYYAISYDTTPDSNDISKRVEKAFKNFYYVPEKSNEQIAELMHKLEIDIAVDLKGYTYGTRIEILAHKPAPIQLTYLGYPGTTGNNYIDYALLDNYVVTDENEKYFTEKVIKMDGCYQVTDNRRLIPLVQSREKYGLPNDKFIFCSFNNPYKIQPYIFKTWLEILKKKKDSILWLLCNEENTKKTLHDFASKKGIEAERIIFCDLTANNEHMQRLTCADLMLDTFPVCSHTTASDALWAGLPLVTMSGKSMVSRVAGSILKNMKLENLITNNLKDYKEKILFIANNPNYLKEIKSKIVESRRTSSLFNTEKTTKKIEEQYKILFNQFLNRKY